MTTKQLQKLLGSRIKEARELRGITQEGLTDNIDVGLSYPFVDRYENGIIEPPLITLLEIADALDVSMDYLFGRTMIEQKESIPLPQTNASYLDNTYDVELPK